MLREESKIRLIEALRELLKIRRRGFFIMLFVFFSSKKLFTTSLIILFIFVNYDEFLEIQYRNEID